MHALFVYECNTEKLNLVLSYYPLEKKKLVSVTRQ